MSNNTTRDGRLGDDFYSAGGAISPDARTYVERPADRDLFEAVIGGDYCTLLTARQLGKTSLIYRLGARLPPGFRFVFVDLQAGVGSRVQFYAALCSEIAKSCGLEKSPIHFAAETQGIAPERLFQEFLSGILAHIGSDRLVVAIDEIDMLLPVDFRDDVFAVIRACYNVRPRDASFQRLIFLLVGAVPPDELSSDSRKSPFNIGRRIELGNLERVSAEAILSAGLPYSALARAEVFNRVWYWTNGHPYLTQRLCRELSQSLSDSSNPATAVDYYTRQLFLGDYASDAKTCVAIKNFVRGLRPDIRSSFLMAYFEIYRRRSGGVDIDPRVKLRLLISGLVQIGRDGEFHRANQIFASVFDEKWIEAEQRRIVPAQGLDTQGRPSLLGFGLAILAVTGPFVLTFLFRNSLGTQLWRSLAVIVLYEFSVVGFFFGRRIWERLEVRWLGHLPQWIDSLLLALLYRRRYLRHLTYRHGTFDVKGLMTQGIYTLELEQVVVEPRLVELANPQVSSSRAPSLVSGTVTHDIWEYLNAGKLSKANLAIIGAPGSGKTALLKHLSIRLAAGGAKASCFRTPILLWLREITPSLKADPTLSIVDVFRESMFRAGLPVPAGWAEGELERGRCLVMLDGLDEIGGRETSRLVAEWIEQQVSRYPQNVFVVTARPVGYMASPVSGFQVLTIEPFTSEQVYRFVKNWYLANEVVSAGKLDEGVRIGAREGAEDLIRRIRSVGALSELAVNPLLLTMIATVHRYRGALPGRRVELYREIVEVFLGRRRLARGIDIRLTPDQQRRILATLAYAMMRRQVRDIRASEASAVVADSLENVKLLIAPIDWLREIENESGLLTERENQVYGFSHLIFQEYLAASHVRERGLGSELLKQIGNMWWREVIVLYAAETDATAIVDECLKHLSPMSLELAINCADEAQSLDPSSRDRLSATLRRSIESSDPEYRSLAREALWARRLRRMLQTDDLTYVDTSLITGAEYQMFLPTHAPGPKHALQKEQRGVQTESHGLDPVVEISAADARGFCDWLTEHSNGTWRFRLPTIREAELPCSPSSTALGVGLYYWATGENGELVLMEASGKGSAPTESTAGIAVSLRIVRQRWLNRVGKDAVITGSH